MWIIIVVVVLFLLVGLGEAMKSGSTVANGYTAGSSKKKKGNEHDPYNQRKFEFDNDNQIMECFGCFRDFPESEVIHQRVNEFGEIDEDEDEKDTCPYCWSPDIDYKRN